MSNALDENEQQQICALGRLGWTLLRIQHATGVRRETVGAYRREETAAWPDADPDTPGVSDPPTGRGATFHVHEGGRSRPRCSVLTSGEAA